MQEGLDYRSYPSSNTIDIPESGQTDVAFSLHIDVGGEDPSQGDIIAVLLWDDANSDGTLDAIESYYPFQSQSTCHVWGPSTFCWFIFSNKEWYIVQASTVVSVDEGDLSGALILGEGP